MRILNIEYMTSAELVELIKCGGVIFLNALIISHYDVVIRYRKDIYNYAKGSNNKMMMKMLERRFRDLRPKPLVRVLSNVLQYFGIS